MPKKLFLDQYDDDGLVITSHKINNGKLEFHNNGYWYRNGKLITPYVASKYKVYDKKFNTYRTLGESTLDVDKPYTKKFDKIVANHVQKNVDEWKLPSNKMYYNPKDGVITLKTKGKSNLATIPVSELDSIAVSSGRANVPFKQALGLVGQETRFGGWAEYLNRNKINIFDWFNGGRSGLYKSKHGLTNNHAYFVDPYHNYYSKVIENSEREFPDNGTMSENELRDRRAVYVENQLKYAIKHKDKLIEPNHKMYYEPDILADAFMRYADNPKKWNPGQPKQEAYVSTTGNEVFNEPQIQNYWNTRGKKYYDKGIKEGNKYRLSQMKK